MTDDIIQEVWKAKDAVAARHGHDLRALARHLRDRDRESTAVVVDLTDRRNRETRTS